MTIDRFTAQRIANLVRDIESIWDRAPNITEDEAENLPFLQLYLRRLRGEWLEGDDGTGEDSTVRRNKLD